MFLCFVFLSSKFSFSIIIDSSWANLSPFQGTLCHSHFCMILLSCYVPKQIIETILSVPVATIRYSIVFFTIIYNFGMGASTFNPGQVCSWN